MTSTKGIKCVNSGGDVPFLSFPCPHCGQDPTKAKWRSDVFPWVTDDEAVLIGGLVFLVIILIWSLE
jgi:hypothetical protein